MTLRWSRRSARCADRSRKIPQHPARRSVGREGHHRRQRLQNNVGFGCVSRADDSRGRDGHRIAARGGRSAVGQAHHGELAGGDQWFGGRTNNPWKLDEGASGSSAGPGSATAAGCVAFSIGNRNRWLDSQSLGTGAAQTGLRPTFGRVSRHGVMALSWTQDRLGPICRYAEDCAAVLSVIAQPDDRDLSVSSIPFNWDARASYRKLRIGYLVDAFADSDRDPDWIANDRRALDRIRSMGVQLVPLSVPEFPIDVLSLSVEAGVFFDEFLRSASIRR